jgi:hypothetical protein
MNNRVGEFIGIPKKALFRLATPVAWAIVGGHSLEFGSFSMVGGEV